MNPLKAFANLTPKIIGPSHNQEVSVKPAQGKTQKFDPAYQVDISSSPGADHVDNQLAELEQTIAAS